MDMIHIQSVGWCGGEVLVIAEVDGLERSVSGWLDAEDGDLVVCSGGDSPLSFEDTRTVRRAIGAFITDAESEAA